MKAEFWGIWYQCLTTLSHFGYVETERSLKIVIELFNPLMPKWNCPRPTPNSLAFFGIFQSKWKHRNKPLTAASLKWKEYPEASTVSSQPPDRIQSPWLANPHNPAMRPQSRHLLTLIRSVEWRMKTMRVGGCLKTTAANCSGLLKHLL